MIRKAAVKDRFYPGEVGILESMILQWQKHAVIEGCSVAIVPHAGYQFSGECAWKALTQVDWKNYKRAVVIGPSHRVAFSGISVSTADEYETVGGFMPMDREFADSLIEEKYAFHIDAAHFEHSTEVQVPLIHRLNPLISIVECVYGSGATANLIHLIKRIRRDNDSIVIISTDLSHYHNEKEAHLLDEHIRKGITTLDLLELYRGEACGRPGIEALISVSTLRDETISVVDYRTSADSDFGDSEQVVGYLSAIVEKSGF